MNVIFCYASEPHPIALEAVAKFAPDAELVETPGLFGYNEAIASRWGVGDLVVIEGDKEISSEVIPSFASCDEPWCTFSYYNYPEPYQANCTVGLGCAKFSVALQRQIPTSAFLGPDIPTMVCRDCDGAGCWRYLDTRIAFAILSRCITFSPHVHGEINHHHEYPDDWAKQRGLE